MMLLTRAAAARSEAVGACIVAWHLSASSWAANAGAANTWVAIITLVAES